MSVVQVKTSNALGGVKLDEVNDSLSTVVKQGIGKEPFLSLPRSTDSAVQWIPFINQDLSGWPLHSPKFPMQKCRKCKREFFSSINQRRHTRVQHRLKKPDKDSLKRRDELRVFWDKLSADEAKEIVALKNATVEDLPGATIIKALSSLIHKSVFPPLPHFCIKSGSALLEIVQARLPRFPISSEELFSILDDASEKTFLSDRVISFQKYLFDGEVGKIGLDTKNLVAFVSFLLELKLVEACEADRGAESLICQKLLVEEEEADQKRRAENLEKKKRKKLRQKEQKAKERRDDEGERSDSFDILEAELPSETSPDVNASDLEILDLAGPSQLSEISQLPIAEEADSEAQTGVGYDKDFNSCENIEPRSHQPLGAPSWHVAPKPRAISNGFYQIKNLSTSKPEFIPKHGTRDLRIPHSVNKKKVWSQKPKPEKEGENLKLRVQEEASVQVVQDEKHEVLIGSIAVNLGSCDIREKCDQSDLPVDDCKRENQSPKKTHNVKERHSKSDSILCGANQSTIKLLRRRQEVKDSIHVQGGAEVDSSVLKDGSLAVHEESCLKSASLNGHAGGFLFSGEAARTFFSQRWKEAIAADHVTLVLSLDPDTSPPGTEDCEERPDSKGRSILGNAENRMENGPLHSGIAKPELKMKPEKEVKKRYIPKQREK